MFLSLFCIASEYQPLCNNLLFGGGAPPAAWQTSPVFFIVLGLALHRRMLHFYLEIADFIFEVECLSISDHSSNPMHEFVLDIVQCNLLLFPSFHEPPVVPLHNGIEVDCSQGSLGQHSLNLSVRHVMYAWIRMHAGPRLLSERGGYHSSRQSSLSRS